MDVRRRSRSEEAGGPYSSEAIRQIYGQISKACLFAGLSAPDAEDVAQDIWYFLLRSGSPVVALAAPWIGAVVRNFIRRYWRKQGRRRLREGISLEEFSDGAQARNQPPQFEENEILDRLEAILPALERQILVLIRAGHTAWEAGEILGIPEGSRVYRGGRLVRCARGQLRGRRDLVRAIPAASPANPQTLPRT